MKYSIVLVLLSLTFATNADTLFKNRSKSQKREIRARCIDNSNPCEIYKIVSTANKTVEHARELKRVHLVKQLEDVAAEYSLQMHPGHVYRDDYLRLTEETILLALGQNLTASLLIYPLVVPAFLIDAIKAPFLPIIKSIQKANYRRTLRKMEKQISALDKKSEIKKIVIKSEDAYLKLIRDYLF